ncbi:MAG: hypothetical protein UZ22_OP11002000242 [Microgenomates bacterium OLB23]|nr:MAG: hypothetical protein UZ22_OP11002000242 [Microgenomates bacterium OLB23]
MSPEELRTAIDEQKTAPASGVNTGVHPQELFSWQAPIRPYKKKSQGVLRFYIAIAFLLTLLVYFLGDYILILPIWSTLFVVYVFTVTPPLIVTYRITKFGLDIAGRMYRWESLSHYYLLRRF